MIRKEKLAKDKIFINSKQLLTFLWLEKLVIFFISSDKNDKNSAGAGSTKHAAERSEGVAKAWGLIKGQVGPRAQLPRKAQKPTKCLAFEIKENTENIAEYRQKKLVSSLFFLF